MNDWLRTDEAAAWLGVSKSAVRVIAHRLHWRRVRIGRVSGYLVDDVATEVQRRDAEKRAKRTTVV